MTDTQTTSGATVHEGGKIAGEMLRQAREAQGMHISALAVAVKVQQRKLEALEAGRLDELPDATFARALAQTVCRHLHIDPKPVLERLPQAGYGPRLEQVAQGLNEPFRSHGGLPSLGSDWTSSLRPAVILPAVLAVAAAGIALWPRSKSTDPAQSLASASQVIVVTSASGAGPLATDPAAAGASTASSVMDAVVQAAPLVASPVLGSGSSPVVGEGASSVGAAAGMILVRSTQKSWVEIKDGSGRTLVNRALNAGEPLSVDGTPPFKLKIGNASSVQLSYQGQPVDLNSASRGNVARLELK